MRKNKGGGREERREGGRKRGKERGRVVYRYVSWRESIMKSKLPQVGLQLTTFYTLEEVFCRLSSLNPRPPKTERREAWYLLYVYLCACTK